MLAPTISHYLRWSFGLAKAETQTTEAERDCLAKYATGKRSVAEIGVWHGVTTCRLLAAMDRKGTLYAVDPYPTGRLGISFQRRIARREIGKHPGNVVWLRMTGVEAAGRVDAVDFIFIDGDHSFDGIRGDWEAWKEKIVPGGIVALHDSRPTPDRPIHDAGSVIYTNKVIRNDPSFSVVCEVDSLTVLQRQNG